MQIKVARMREGGVSEDEAVVRVVCGELGIKPMKIEVYKRKEGNSDPKKIIDEDDLERFVAEGWDVQTVLPSGKILVRK